MNMNMNYSYLSASPSGELLFLRNPRSLSRCNERSLQWSLQGYSKALSKHDLRSSQQGGANHRPLCQIGRIHLSLRQHQDKNTGQYLDKSTSPTHRNHLFVMARGSFMKATHPFMVAIHPPVRAMFHFTRMSDQIGGHPRHPATTTETPHKIYPKDKKYSGANDILDMKLR